MKNDWLNSGWLKADKGQRIRFVVLTIVGWTLMLVMMFCLLVVFGVSKGWEKLTNVKYTPN